ncbi:MAG TPA: hypothetical protein VER37_08490, partial [Thermomicrobiales bacterium]|nr:hypothetical protein [Thermomicrobiales bacterium]
MDRGSVDDHGGLPVVDPTTFLKGRTAMDQGGDIARSSHGVGMLFGTARPVTTQRTVIVGT